MNTIQEIAELKNGSIIYDKFSVDEHGEPLEWEVMRDIVISRTNEDFFIRKLSLAEGAVPLDPEDSGFTAIHQDNLFDFTTDKKVARIYCAGDQMEKGNVELATKILDRAMASYL